ncbi:FAD/NAD(P)-binding domain-containing protein [Gonapodya prolifera JEL478]|uniref:FAD/NAD(P)-binding domain-containing protein n=1 Tax=Gonapodya prolifera (strain JEL478) TaxID=1344416 RepID=A0A139AFH0_GONPJ|nr:FAD/NAD(P)-binding domain-containing protein [Gonapodya prolifera JEL478]|eukprot:KXS15500.1 FAD/NAD(P)-binding domain-containing protein [Gonapodya prolifera JEL478]
MVTDTKQPRVGIVGAGLSGICSSLFLREKLGITNIIGVERHADFGGTWYENNYPGLACDVPAHIYSFSFAMNPDWSCPYPPRDELLAYIHSVAHRFSLQKHFRFLVKTTRCVWSDENNSWTVYYKDMSKLSGEAPLFPSDKDLEVLEEESFECDFLFNTTKGSGNPGLPLIPGVLEGKFKGRWWHSMLWPSDGLDYCQDKRVALIGCAAAAVQLVPQLQRCSGHLTVFHRTPNHVMRRYNTPYTDEQKQVWKKDPLALRAFKTAFQRDFSKGWQETAFGEVDGDVAKRSLEEARRNLEDNVDDPQMREWLWPDFPLWCRRVCFHDDFYPALAKPNVTLMQDRIVEVNEHGVVTARQNARDKVIDPTAPHTPHSFDVIIYATGWAAPGNKVQPFPVIGVNGLEYAKRALNLYPAGGKFGVQSYMGQMLDGFPNYFAPAGPTGLALSALIVAMETGISYCLKVLKYAIDHNLASIGPTYDATQRWIEIADGRMKGKPYAQGDCSGYHKTYRSDGTWTNRVHFAGTTHELIQLLEYPVWSDFTTKPLDPPVQWRQPTPPVPSMLDEAFQGVHVVSARTDSQNGHPADHSSIAEIRTR